MHLIEDGEEEVEDSPALALQVAAQRPQRRSSRAPVDAFHLHSWKSCCVSALGPLNLGTRLQKILRPVQPSWQHTEWIWCMEGAPMRQLESRST